MQLSKCEKIRPFKAKEILTKIINNKKGRSLYVLFTDIINTSFDYFKFSKSNPIDLPESEFYLYREFLMESKIKQPGKQLRIRKYTNGFVDISKYTYISLDTMNEKTIGYIILTNDYSHIKHIDDIESKNVEGEIEKYEDMFNSIWKEIDYSGQWSIN